MTCITFSFEQPEQYLNVIAAQTALLNYQQTGVTLRMEQMVAAVQLIKAPGGAWECLRNRLSEGVGIKTAGSTLRVAV